MTAIIKGQQLMASLACRQRQGIGEVDPASAMAQRILDFVMIFNRNPGQGHEVCKAVRHLAGRLLSDGAQHPSSSITVLGTNTSPAASIRAAIRACAGSSCR